MDPPGWYFGLNTRGPIVAPRTAHVVEQASTSAHTAADVIAQSQTYNAGFIYIGDQLCNGANGAQYGHLTQYYATLAETLGSVLTIDKTTGSTGTGKVVALDQGINCDPTAAIVKCSNRVPKLAPVALTATPDPNSQFAGFFEGATQLCTANNPPNQCTVTLTTDTTVNVRFSTAGATTGTVNLTKTGDGDGLVATTPAGISCDVGCASQSAQVTAGQVTVNATADGSSLFDHFEIPGNADCTSNCTFSLAASGTAAVKAVFVHPNLSVVLSGGGSGSVTSQPTGIDCGATCSADFPKGQVSLTAMAAGNSTFAGFSGGGCGTTNPCSVDLTAATTVTATFNLGGLCPRPQVRCCEGSCVNPFTTPCPDVCQPQGGE